MSKNSDKIQEILLQIIAQNPGKEMNHKQIAWLLPQEHKITGQDLDKLLQKMASQGQLKHHGRGKFSFVPPATEQSGTLQFTPAGRVFVVNPEEEIDLSVSGAFSNRILHGDLVHFRTEHSRSGKQKAFITKVIRHQQNPVVGIIRKSGKKWFLQPDEQRFHVDLELPHDINKDLEGHIATVKIKGWPANSAFPQVEILDVFGLKGDNDAEMHAIVAEFGFSHRFDRLVEDEAAAFADKLLPADYRDREDLRDRDTFTIDPADAKDFDDALSFRQLPDGMLEIGVHIADVSHYVRPGTHIDSEAALRGTSIYLVDRTIPMLPEKLSNNLCSLRPEEDRLAFSAMFTMDRNAQVVDYRFTRSVIHSNKRFTYEEAQEIIEGKEGPFQAELLELNRLAKLMQEERKLNGSITFETEEVRFKVAPGGRPLGIFVKERKDAHKLIEDFMLLANRYVAMHVAKLHEQGGRHPFVYRFHDEPPSLKLRDFSSFCALFGYKINHENPNALKKSLNKLLENIKGKPEEFLLQQQALRSMAKAVYTSRATSHFGLGFSYYTHFTSPIRRYPDLLVHRLLWHYLQPGSGQPAPVEKDHLESILRHSSDMEQKAAEAERASIKYKMAEFMQEHIGRVFEGVVSGVTEWGIYVEMIDNKCEGMVRLGSMKDDEYTFIERSRKVVGRRKNREFTMGDLVSVRVTGADPDKRTIDLRLEE